MKSKKLITKIDFEFDIDIDIPVFNVDMKLNKKLKEHKIINHKYKKKIVDVSTKLF